MSESTWKPETIAVHGGYSPDPTTRAVAVPIYQTVAYAFDSTQHAADLFDLKVPGNIYTRIMNPTNDVLEKRVAALEGGIAALALASGQAAITYAIQTIAEAGDNIVSSSALYGGTYNLFAHTLPQFGIQTRFADHRDPASFGRLIDERTKAVFVESIGNPLGNITDIEAVAAVAHAHGVPLIVDNTVPSPYLLRPFEFGADIVVHSLTKYLGGHGTTLGGVIVEGGKFNWAEVPGKFPTLTEPDPSYHGLNFYEALGGAAFVTRVRAILLRDTGATLSPFAAFLLLQGTETLSLRVERHVQNALKVIDYLKTVPEVESISHPSIEGRKDNDLYKKYFPNGGGSIFTFDIKGGKDAARVFIDNLHLFSLLANVADAKSLVIHPASTTHSQETLEELEDQGIHQGTIRLSIGLENIDDIIEDLESGFKALRESGLAK